MTRIFFLLFLLAYGTASSQSVKWYVNAQNQAANQTGTNWATAFVSLDSALERAHDYDEIWIANGSYIPSLGVGRNRTFSVNKLLKIYGGFVGFENTITERDTNLYATVLTGEVGDTSRYDNLYTIMTLFKCDTSTVLDGLIFERGYALSDTVNSNFSRADCGGAVYVAEQAGKIEPKVNRCVFRQNHARYGGAWFSYAPQSVGNYPIFTDCRFEQDSAYFGGGGYIEGGSERFTLSQCTFFGNMSIIGASLYLVSYKDTAILHIEKNQFIQNYAGNAPGVNFDCWGDLRYYERNISENLAELNNTGDGVFGGTFAGLIYSDQIIEYNSTCVTSTTFTRNVLRKNNFGSMFGFDFNGSQSIKYDIIENIFTENHDVHLNFIGYPLIGNMNIQKNVFSHLYMIVAKVDTAYFRNNVFDSCLVYPNDNDVNHLLVYNNTFINGCEIYDLPRQQTVFKNNIFELAPNQSRFPFEFFDTTATRFDYNLINRTKGQLTLGTPTFHLGPNNLYVPNGQFFKDKQAGDLSLAECSPAINRGVNEYVTSLDFLGNQRLQSCRVDMGAIESSPASLDTVQSTSACDLDGELMATTIPNCPGTQFTWVRNGLESGNLDYNLASGTYDVTVHDAGGCPLGSRIVYIPQLPRPTMALNAVSHVCGGNDGGTVTAHALTGTPPFRTFWYGLGFDSTYQNVYPGTYVAVVADSICWTRDSIAVGTTGDLSLLLEGESPTCNGQSNGYLCVTPLNGVQPFQFQWQDGWQDFCQFQIGAATYQIAVRDSFGCVTEKTFILNQPPSLALDAQITNATTTITQDGAIALTQVGGGTAPYSFLWSTGDTTSFINNLGIGAYSVTFSDAQGCELSGSWVVEATIDVFETPMNPLVSLYPTITTGALSLMISEKHLCDDLIFEVIDVHGKVVFEIMPKSTQSNFRLPDIISGHYFWRLRNLEKMMASGKLVLATQK